MKKSNLQTASFEIIFMAMNGHTYKLFKNIYSGVQTKRKWKIITALHNFCENCILILYKFEGLEKHVSDRFYNSVLQ